MKKLLTFALIVSLCIFAQAVNVVTGDLAPFGLYTGAGTGKVLSTYPTFDACKAAAATMKPGAYTCASKSPLTVVAPAPNVTAWVRSGIEGDTFVLSNFQQTRYGDGITWVTKTASGIANCSVNFFGKDPVPGVYKFCEIKVTVPGVIQTGTKPVVNTALIPQPAVSYNNARIRTLSADELALDVYKLISTDVGAFREPCNFSHMLFDDPIAFPGQPGASHLHTFMGNADANSASNVNSIANSGNSTCGGGTLNRTAYWVPTLIDIRTGQPVVPISTNFYYKLGYNGVKAGSVQTFPLGLRMIAGNANSVVTQNNWNFGLECVSGGGHQNSIPSCAIGDEFNMGVIFPQCWDGVNLDSPDHKSHMAYATGNGCPSDHPVPLPEISLNLHYKVTEANSGKFWKFSSDNYSGPGGYSIHADWFLGWDAATNKKFVTNCINANMDCHDELLGDGTTLY